VNAAKYADLFRAEARERLTEMNQALLAIERGAGTESVSELFRAVHNMKGMSAAMGYQSVRDLSHALETLLERMRREESEPSPAVMDTLFEAVDLLESAVLIVSANPDSEQDVSEMVAALENLATGQTPDIAPPPTMEWPVMTSTRTSSFPVVEGKRSVRVDAERLDTLMTLIGELVIARGRLAELSRHASNPELAEIVSQTSRLVGNLQDEITKSRMVPVGQAFERFDRMVRDTAHDLGKQVNFELRGTDIEVDKSVLDEIGDPVMHLLRNAIDHGIETPAQRKASGKSPVARLILSAERERSAVAIYVMDDGRGIDTKKVLATARANGLVNETRKALTDSELLDLISRPGFSTASAVTRVSGRGVGLDVVATKVKTLGGSLDMITGAGNGTTMIVRLPVTLAIVQALLARTAGEVYALPIAHVVETLVLSQSAVRSDNGSETIEVRGERLPAVRLRERLGHPPRESGAGHVVVLQLPDRRMTLIVDEFIGQQEIVVKPFDAARGMPQIFSGATILPSGRPALILDARNVA
jgi:two-component system chemotaxis sensor kinase CheA